MSRENTREKILDAAEELFSEHGFSATSIRAITTRAEVNLAALNYHFGTKDGVIDAVFARRIEPLNRERIHLLEIVENNSKDRSPDWRTSCPLSLDRQSGWQSTRIPEVKYLCG